MERNRLSTAGIGRFHSCLYTRMIAASGSCERGTKGQSADHMKLSCPIYKASEWETTKPGRQRHSLNHLHMSLNMISQN